MENPSGGSKEFSVLEGEYELYGFQCVDCQRDDHPDIGYSLVADGVEKLAQIAACNTILPFDGY
jgi:hypothetical protein